MTIDPKDLKIDIFRPPDSELLFQLPAIRITHKPTGISVTEYSGKTVAMNRKIALSKLEDLIMMLINK